MTSPPMDLDRLDELAKKATPGPWRSADRTELCAIVYSSQLASDGKHIGMPELNAMLMWPPHDAAGEDAAVARTYANADLIAALDPATVRYLVARARRAQEAENLLEGACARLGNLGALEFAGKLSAFMAWRPTRWDTCRY